MPTIYGYIRVSTRAQKDERQWLSLRQAGVEDQHIFVDKATGKHFNRPAYRRMLCRLRPGDLLVVQSIDRLGRNYEEMLRQWRLLVEEKQVDVQVLDMPLLDTRRRKSATTALMADMLLRLLSYMAQAEREAIRSRQAQGIAAAKARGGALWPAAPTGAGRVQRAESAVGGGEDLFPPSSAAAAHFASNLFALGQREMSVAPYGTLL